MRFAAILLLAVLATVTSGCSPKGYFTDRWADAKDIFTATVGTGGGVKARVGFVQVGEFYNSDIAGLRGGASFSLSGDFRARPVFDFASTIPWPLPERCGDFPLPVTSAEDFESGYMPDEKIDPAATKRGKKFAAIMPVLPALTFSDCPYYYTQVEVAIGAGGTLRLGFNPGELLDFLLGWTTLDIFQDDLKAQREREAAIRTMRREKPPEAPSAPPAPPPPQR